MVNRLCSAETLAVVVAFEFSPELFRLWTSVAARTHTFADVAIIGAAPFASLGHVKAMHAEGVRAVINLCDEYRGPTEEYSNLGIKQLYLPTGT